MGYNKKRISPEEKRLWDNFIKAYPVRFSQQKMVENFFADFYCREAKLVIVLDKAQVYDPEKAVEDNIRVEKIDELDLLVISFSSKLIHDNFNDVCLYLDKIIKERVQSLNS